MWQRPSAAPPRAQLACAAAELCWVLPCMVQCWITFAEGHGGPWYQGYGSGAGCDVMGFYSVFSLFAGTGTSVVMSALTDRAAASRPLPSPRAVAAASAAVFSSALLFALLPLWGVGEYKFLQVLCYYDWYNSAHALIIVLWTVPCLLCGSFFFLRACAHEPAAALMLASFVAGWILWPPAAIIGLSGGAMPPNMMIVGAVLGHGQALTNPLLLGYLWPRLFEQAEPPPQEPGYHNENDPTVTKVGPEV